MKYVGIMLSDLEWYQNDWIYDILEDGGNSRVYLINAKNPNEAREKLFNKLYNSEDHKELAIYYLRGLAESIDKNDIFKEFGKNDGEIIYEIACDFQDLLDQGEKELPYYDKRIRLLSSQAIKKMAFYETRTYFGIVNIENELK